MNLKNKKILITGASGGIGKDLVKKFDDLGANILASGTNFGGTNSLEGITLLLIAISIVYFK